MSPCLSCRNSREPREVLARAGAEVFHGDVNDLGRLRIAAEAADGVNSYLSTGVSAATPL